MPWHSTAQKRSALVTNEPRALFYQIAMHAVQDALATLRRHGFDVEPSSLAASRLTSDLKHIRTRGHQRLPLTGVDALASLLPHLHRCLRALSLVNTRIGADGARALAQPLGRLTALTELDLSLIHISEPTRPY